MSVREEVGEVRHLPGRQEIKIEGEGLRGSRHRAEELCVCSHTERLREC